MLLSASLHQLGTHPQFLPAVALNLQRDEPQRPIPRLSMLGQPSGIGAERGAVDEIFNHSKFIVLEPVLGEKLAKRQDQGHAFGDSLNALQ